MTVIEFMEMFVEADNQYFELWSNKEEEIVFQGCIWELSEELESATITSIDNITDNGKNGITLNVDID